MKFVNEKTEQKFKDKIKLEDEKRKKFIEEEEKKQKLQNEIFEKERIEEEKKLKEQKRLYVKIGQKDKELFEKKLKLIKDKAKFENNVQQKNFESYEKFQNDLAEKD